MKKLHLLPTNNPSRIGYYTDSNDTQLYILSNGNVIGEYKLNWKPQHIYITSDEEIKEKDWFLDEVDNSIHNAHKDFSKFKSDVGSTRKKIILTTDQYLIKAGVQSIDNEFLEWFVKNPNCKEVEIKEHWAYYPLGLGKKLITCQVIIPKEETKQETIDNFYCGNEVDYDEQCQNQCDRCVNATGVDYGKLNIKQETIEEAAFRLYPDEEQWTDRHIFKTAANWQASQQTKGDYDKGLTHLRWMYDRLIEVHDESPNYDYMIKFKELIE